MTRKSKWWYPWLIGLAIVGCAVGTYFAFVGTGVFGPMANYLGKNPMPGIKIRFNDAEMVGRSGGMKVWSFAANQVEVSEDRRYATFKGVTRGRVLKDGRQVASVTADEVKYDTILGNVTSPGPAQLDIVDGPSITFHEVLWDPRTSRLLCTGGADAKMAGGTMHGERLIADIPKKEITAFRVHGSIKLDEIPLPVE